MHNIKPRAQSDIPRHDASEFIKVFKNINSLNYPIRFCFILGAGASRSSGIPTGGELAERWFKEISVFFDDFESWKKRFHIDEHNLGKHYGEIYRKRFELVYEEGYQYLESIMKDVEPSFGYSILAQIVSSTKHNVVITTNFDSLTEDAVFIFAKPNAKPLVCGHEFLSEFVNPNTDRPIILKLHRDLLLKPKNDNADTAVLPSAYHNLLQQVFKIYTPIFIGYGGNDGSLMNCLRECNIKPGSKWCIVSDKSKSNEIDALMRDKQGSYVSIDGFEEFMFELGVTLFPDFNADQIIDKITKSRIDNWSSQFISNASKVSCKDGNVRETIKQSLPEHPQSLKDHLLQIICAPESEKQRLFEEVKTKFHSNRNILDIDEFFAQHLRDLNADRKEIIKIESLADDDISERDVSNFYKSVFKNIGKLAVSHTKIQELTEDPDLHKYFDIAVESDKYIFLFAIRHARHRRSVQRVANRINEVNSSFLRELIVKKYDFGDKPIVSGIILPAHVDLDRLGKTIYNVPILIYDSEAEAFKQDRSYDIAKL